MAVSDLAMSYPAMSAVNITLQQSSSMQPGHDGANESAFANGTDDGTYTHAMGDTAGDLGTNSNAPEWANVFSRFGFDFNETDGTQGDTAGGGTGAGDFENAYGAGGTTGGTGGFDDDDFF